MLNFIQVSFCFLLLLQLGLGLGSVTGLGFGIDNLNNYLKIFVRWRCKHNGHSLSLDACDACVATAQAQFAITINSNVCPHIRVPNMLMRESYA